MPTPGIEPATYRFGSRDVKHCTRLAIVGGWYVMLWGLGVRVPTISLFHDEKLAIFDFGVRGTP